MTAFDLAAWSEPRLRLVEARLAACFADAWPERLREACLYPLQTGGKRMRPLLCLAAAEAVGGDAADAVEAAAAVELVHTYSLVHDDLPCMDDDAVRRGRPTVHVVFGEAMGVLVGDALLTEAFAVLAASARGPRLAAELARAAGAAGMIAGQVADISGGVTDLDALVRLHRAKTGALLRAAARMGAICAGGDPAALAAVDAYGDALGLAFQARDDLLDADQDAGADGPPSFVKLLGVAETAAAARRYADEALAAVAGLRSPEALQALARYTVERSV